MEVRKFGHPGEERTSALVSGRPSVLSYLAFENPSLRLGLELGLCFVLFATIQILNTFSGPPQVAFSGHGQGMASLAAWFIACSLIALTDLLLFGPPQRVYRRSVLLSLAGSDREALDSLQAIAPEEAARLVTCPSTLYKVRRAQILMYADKFNEALLAAHAASQSGLPVCEHCLLRIQIFRLKGDFERARLELTRARALGVDERLLAFEEGLLLLSKRNDFRSAARSFEAAQRPGAQALWNGEDLSLLAAVFQAAARLWTGHAEENLRALDRLSRRLRMQCSANESLRHLAAWATLEQAFYLATHKAPHEAIEGIRYAYGQCRHPAIKRLALQVEKELCERYKILPAELP
jgi:hypothetical protein